MLNDAVVVPAVDDAAVMGIAGSAVEEETMDLLKPEGVVVVDA